MELTLSLATPRYDRVLPLIDGEVKLDGVTLNYVGMPGSYSRVFYDLVKFQRYDVSEMSISTFLRMRSIGWPYRILPVFHNRSFFYTMIRFRRGSGIRQNHPEDLEGKRVGIGDYQQSLGLWTRGILQMEFGVDPDKIIWYQERGKHLSHTGASAEAGLTIPKTVELHYAKTDFGTMYLNNELDASFAPTLRLVRDADSGIDRIGPSLSENSDLVTLFREPRQEAIRFYRKTGIFPPQHATVIRESILDKHPWVAVSLMEAFEESKRIAIERLRRIPPTLMVFGEYYLAELDELFGRDPYPYGIRANAKAFDMAQTFSVQQGLTERKQPFDEIFPQEVVYLEECSV
jgi:4,5-dihydroxyphthalate decarboxylase